MSSSPAERESRVAALLLTALFVRDTGGHVQLEQRESDHDREEAAPRLRQAFPEASYRRPALRSCSQAGLVNNLNDALAWGLVPLFLAAHGASAAEIGLVAGLYPGVWGVGQILTGQWSDHIGRKPLIVAGMLLQAAALGLLAASDGAVGLAAAAAIVLGVGTALVYPTLIAAISDAVSPVARAPTLGVYRFWRDMGYVVGGLLAGFAADAIGYTGAIAVVAALTAASGTWVAIDLPERPSLGGGPPLKKPPPHQPRLPPNWGYATPPAQPGPRGPRPWAPPPPRPLPCSPPRPPTPPAPPWRAAPAPRVGGGGVTLTLALQEPESTRCCDTRSVLWNRVCRELAQDNLARASLAINAEDEAFELDTLLVSRRHPADAVTREAAIRGANEIILLDPRSSGLGHSSGVAYGAAARFP